MKSGDTSSTNLGDATAKITALYARVTREESIKKGLSIPNQKRRFQELVEQYGWDPSIVFEEDRAVSGELPPEQRPALRELLAAARRGELCRVVFRHLDRLGRGDVVVPILTELASHGIEVRDFSGPIDAKTAAGKFSSRVQAAVGAFESERTGERIREMKRGKAKDGYHLGPAPFGYTSQARLRRQLHQQGQSEEEARIEAQKQIPISPGLIIDENEAAIVLEVFEAYVERRMGTRQIANDLNARGLLRRGRPWHPTQVVNLIHDPKTAGWVTFDEEAYEAKQPSSAPVHLQERFEAKHEAIIERELFDAAERLLGVRRSSFVGDRKQARPYPLSGVLLDSAGHRMKGRSSRKGSDRWAYYSCSVRSRRGTDPDLAGCNCSAVRADDVEDAVRKLLTGLLASPDTILRAWETARRKLVQEAPERRAAARKLRDEISGLERERESAFNGLRNADLDPEQYRVIADRVRELNDRVRTLEAKEKELDRPVVPFRAPRLEKAQVAAYLSKLDKKLKKNPEAFQELVQLLHMHHGLALTAEGPHDVRMELYIEAGVFHSKQGKRDTAIALEPRIPITLVASVGKPRMTREEWASLETEKGHICACGCGGMITVRPGMRAPTVGIPKFIQGHHKMSMTKFVEALNDEGFVTVFQAARELGVGETTLRRAEERGWIKPERRAWGGRQPMRVYRKDELPALRERMKATGFRFKDDDSLMTTKKMANALGIPESRLRYMERTGKVPKQDRASNGTRMWQRGDVGMLKRKLRALPKIATK